MQSITLHDTPLACPQGNLRFISQLWRKIGCKLKSGSDLGTRLTLHHLGSPPQTTVLFQFNTRAMDWSPLSTPSLPPPGWYQRLVHSLAESCVCLAAVALAVEWQYSSPQESSGVPPSRSREPGKRVGKGEG